MGDAFLNGGKPAGRPNREAGRRPVAGAARDGLSRDLALLAVELDLLGRNPPKSPALLRERVRALAARARELSSDAHHIEDGSQGADAPAAGPERAGPHKPPGELSPRQREVLELLAEGHSMKETARLLKITARTVAFHKYSMMGELGIRTSAELIQYAIRQRIIAG